MNCFVRLLEQLFLRPPADRQRSSQTKSRHTCFKLGSRATAQFNDAGVVGAHAVSAPIAAAAANELRRAHAAPCAIVLAWTEQAPPARGTLSRPAQRMAQRLIKRGFDAVACGRIVWITLPADAEQAAEAVARVRGWAEVPTIVSIMRARKLPLEASLAESDLVIFVLPEPALSGLGDLACRSVVPAPRCVVAMQPLKAGVTRELARRGYGRLRGIDAGALPTAEVTGSSVYPALLG